MFCKGRRGNRCLCGQNEILGCSSALSSGPSWAPASCGESQKLLWLGCRRKQTSPMERKGNHRAAALWCLRLGPNRMAGRFPWGQGSWRGEGPRVSPGLWPHGPLAWWLPFSARLASSSQMLRIPIFCVPTQGFFPGKGGERCTGNFESAKTLSFQSSSWSFMRETARPGFGAISCLPLWIHLSSCSGSAWFCYTYRLFCLLASC